jgi:hypothetical protein
MCDAQPVEVNESSVSYCILGLKEKALLVVMVGATIEMKPVIFPIFLDFPLI